MAAMIFFSCQKKIKDDSSATITDIDGNIYKTITIGTQTWLSENLKTTHYKDKVLIPLITNDTDWSKLSSDAYCWYDNDLESNKNIYGALYTWFAVNTGKLCPYGWHVPSDDEWTILTNYLGGQNVAGHHLKEVGSVHWEYQNASVTNSSGFTALPGGRRIGYSFEGMNRIGYWWSSSICEDEYRSEYAWHRELSSIGGFILRDNSLKRIGYSVRCIKD